MMELFEVLKNRHSYRGQFLKEDISREDLEKIASAAILAPSGCNRQTTEFVVVDEKNLVAEIAAIEGANPAVQTASAFILCIVDKDPQPVYQGLSFQVEDCSAAVENMLLAITDMGYASVWVDGWLRREGRNEKIAELVGLPENKTVRILLPIGKPAQQGHQPEKLPLAQRVWFNEYKDGK
jgi:nitroreductase